MTNLPPQFIPPAVSHPSIKKVFFHNSNEMVGEECDSSRQLFLKPQSASSISLSSSTYVKGNTFAHQNLNVTTESNQMDTRLRVKINFERLKSKMHIGTSVLFNKYTLEALGCKDDTTYRIHINNSDIKKLTKESPARSTIKTIDGKFSPHLASKTNPLNSSRILSSNSYFQTTRNDSFNISFNPITIVNDSSVSKFSAEANIGNLSLDLINLEKKLVTIQSQSAPVRKRNLNLSENLTSSHLNLLTTQAKVVPTAAKVNYANQISQHETSLNKEHSDALIGLKNETHAQKDLNESSTLKKDTMKSDISVIVFISINHINVSL